LGTYRFERSPMFTRATLAAGLWAMAASAQLPPPRLIDPPDTPKKFEINESVLREIRDEFQLEIPVACSIPLTEFHVSANRKSMPILRPSASFDRMPAVRLPAPPCKGNKR
jgi:hypothetical protein